MVAARALTAGGGGGGRRRRGNHQLGGVALQHKGRRSGERLVGLVVSLVEQLEGRRRWSGRLRGH